MKTKVKNQSTKKSNIIAFVMIKFFQEDQLLRELNFITQTGNLKSIGEFCKKKNKKFRDKVYKYLVDEPEQFNDLFCKTDNPDQHCILTSDNDDMFQEYTNIVQHYLCCFEKVLSFIEQYSVDGFTFLITVDLSDESKSEVLGNYSILGEKDPDIDFQLN